MVRSPKDIWSGIIYILFGSTALFIGRDYPMGTALRMGPAYFPSLLGGALILIGAIAVIRSFVVQGAAVGALAWRKAALIAGSVVLFGFTVRGLGVAIALPLLIISSASASSRFSWRASIVMATGLTIFCILVFIKGLGVPLPIIGSWLAG